MFAVICAAAAGFLAYAGVKAAVPSVPVLVAGKNLAPGMKLDYDNLAVRKMPPAALPSDRVTDFESVVGKHIQTSVAAGDPIRNSHVSELKSGGTVAAKLTQTDPSLRAVALPAEATKGLKIEEGDRLDVIAVIDQGKALKVIAEKAPVIAVSASEENRDASVTVGLTPDQALQAAQAITGGKILAVLAPLGG
ncbi:Flp pilus assembly protein CpaB [Syntrophothermus sp.]|uniref:Flp pilus assembly protein CpaB n=1 Tax=Syntrophothermus sp. TaxID=2736299 RepID=UPI002579CF7F|nr:Flp pilus assembly protein CpaB [Syntrophothermus sp.]